MIGRFRDMTVQQLILTKMTAGLHERDGLVVNPFCGASREYILEHWDYAKEIYESVWRCFLSTWFRHRDILPCPPPGCDKLVV